MLIEKSKWYKDDIYRPQENKTQENIVMQKSQEMANKKFRTVAPLREEGMARQEHMRASKVLVIPSSSASGWEQGAVSLLLSFPSLLSLCMYLTLSPLYSNIFPFEHNNSNNFHVTLSPGPVSAQRLLAGTPMCPGALSWDPCLRQLHVAPCST